MPQTIASCPIESCRWTLDITGTKSPDGTVREYPDSASLFRAVTKAYDDAIRVHLETHSLVEWVQDVMRLRGERDEARSRAADELTALTEELGLYERGRR